MAQSDQRSNRDKSNKGQDENVHTFVAPDGTQVEDTQRNFRSTLRDQGYVSLEDFEASQAEAPAPEAPAEESAPAS